MHEYGRLEVHALERLEDLLAAHGRTHGLFTGTERLTSGVAEDAVWVRSAPSPAGHRGLAVHCSGQRRAWSPLRYNAHGAGHLPGAGGFCTAARIRVQSQNPVPFHVLPARPRDVADELTARLHLAFRQAC